MSCESGKTLFCFHGADEPWSPSYIRALHAYLVSFTKRSQPLVDVETQQREAEEQFDKIWEAGVPEEWQDARQAKAPATENGEGGIWCAACEYAQHFRRYTC